MMILSGVGREGGNPIVFAERRVKEYLLFISRLLTPPPHCGAKLKVAYQERLDIFIIVVSIYLDASFIWCIHL